MFSISFVFRVFNFTNLDAEKSLETFQTIHGLIAVIQEYYKTLVIELEHLFHYFAVVEGIVNKGYASHASMHRRWFAKS